MAHTWGSQGGKTGVGGVRLGRPPHGQVLNSRHLRPRGAPATCGKSTYEYQLYHLRAVVPAYCHCSCSPEPLAFFPAHFGRLSLGCGVCVSLALVPVVGERLQETPDDSSSAGSDTAQEGLQEAGSKSYLGGGRRQLEYTEPNVDVH